MTEQECDNMMLFGSGKNHGIAPSVGGSVIKYESNIDKHTTTMG